MAYIEVKKLGEHSISVYISFNMEANGLTIPFARVCTVSTHYLDNKGDYIQVDAKTVNRNIVYELRGNLEAMVKDIEYMLNTKEGTAAKLENGAFQPIPVSLDDNYILEIE